ncbi:hypothetical protein RO3G_16478 [Rhizopus delemar RA 99-880]|uniref:Uncharacterized protein n=1 Tax=Rhizopus delemar (strain RA 99-880 / ATCC MYA-4621 / FGSC 9543 / NRRL 43880) TaxID=246409 RepID=I1CTI7_RHIO9|nr:hypothetical protein RO3G_16478 [Rhizopus delemar RA 99-880]|eukprot:EIE91767.1 hypothetical protein RO3G_16478 [Rhizopus delemar RA 99-880]
MSRYCGLEIETSKNKRICFEASSFTNLYPNSITRGEASVEIIEKGIEDLNAPVMKWMEDSDALVIAIKDLQE